ncbi:MAG: gamma-glutamylcyclotransferase [Sulfurospirillaceae bacterium]|jgi:gamma-glutamylcyclotransferase (GGCT)/AIG2-like uncharacterized protein YtfP|nr:gamma-glutamylcyclotransferase [Sulfurospirillaceae bacterium]MDD2826900.1 gamma-glutamylcyclotransferase [Sulfurospirillaceae bacterium]
MAHLLTYGSLMFSGVWKRLIKGDYKAERGTINGYARRCVKGDEYPVIFPANESVTGVVYFDISEEDMKILDAFEGEYYERKTLIASLGNHQSVQVEVYVLKEQYYLIIDDKPWSETYFAQEGIKRFLDNYKGFV